MRLIIGLGNPGEKYENNRHNVGYMVVDRLKGQTSKVKGIVVAKTNTFMNESGEFVEKLVEQCKAKPSDLWIIHDDLDIPLGTYKIQKGRGPKDHKGLMSIDRALGIFDYWHVRIGVDNRKAEPFDFAQGNEYVLQDFTDDEMVIINKVIKEVCKRLVTS